MKRDAHYYAILAFSRACGFKKESAQLLAYASQFVDDAKINLMFIKNLKDKIEQDQVGNRPAFFNMATCHSYFRMKTFNYEAMVNNTSAFHFVPGCNGENFTKRLRCKEETPVVLDLLNDALKQDDLVRLGIVLHTYVDTFSHQGFSGMLSKVNRIKNCEPQTKVYLGLPDKAVNLFKQLSRKKFEKYFDGIAPAYGHSQAMDFPDIPYLVWAYEYDYSNEFNGTYKRVEISNKERYIRAFQGIRKHLENYLGKHSQYLDRKLTFRNFEILMDTLVYEGTDKERVKNWQRILVKQGLFSKKDKALLIYDDNQWLREAFRNFDPKVFDRRKVEGVQLADNFVNSNWYRFYLSVKWYKKKFFEYCLKYQLYIPN